MKPNKTTQLTPLPETKVDALVDMIRSEGFNGPKTARVHLDEVDNFKKGGWIVVESDK